MRRPISLRIVGTLLAASLLCAQTVQGLLNPTRDRATCKRVSFPSLPVSCSLSSETSQTRRASLRQLHGQPAKSSTDDTDSEINDADTSIANDNNNNNNNKRGLHVRARRFLLFAATSLASWNRGMTPAHAKYAYELRETPTTSLRPGMSRTEADQVEKGELTRDQVVQQETTTVAPTSDKSNSLYDLDDDEDDFFEDDVIMQAPKTKIVATETDKAYAKKLQASRNGQFASYHTGKSKALTAKVSAAIFIPTFGGQIVREYVRRRREEAYVKKGLEVMEAQKAEYFNVTSKTADADVQDELKKIKSGEDESDDENDSDDEDDSDDDDDDDDEPPPPPRRPSRGGPKDSGPRDGGSGGGGSSSSGSGGTSSKTGSGKKDRGKEDLGYGKPSEEDLDRLNKMFGRS
jgi:hypothetical protein